MITNSAISPEITTAQPVCIFLLLVRTCGPTHVSLSLRDKALQPRKPLDANRYATKKTIAQGMLDIALLTANASQLKYILQVGSKHEFYSLMLGLITTSIVLQVGIGVLFVSLNLMRDCRLHLIEYKTSALVINHLALVGSFCVTALNLLISAFDPSLGRLAPANTELAL